MISVSIDHDIQQFISGTLALLSVGNGTKLHRIVSCSASAGHLKVPEIEHVEFTFFINRKASEITAFEIKEEGQYGRYHEARSTGSDRD